MGEEGIEENGQEQWEGKVKSTIDMIDIIFKNFKKKMGSLQYVSSLHYQRLLPFKTFF